MRVTRFSSIGPGWEAIARAHYPFLFGRMSEDTIRATYGMHVHNDGSVPRIAGDAVWMGHERPEPLELPTCQP